MADEYKKAAAQLRGMVKVGVIDGNKEHSLVEQFGIEGFPTILLFSYGLNQKASPQTYDAARTANAIANFAVRAIPSFVTVLKTMDELTALKPKDSLAKPLILLFSSQKRYIYIYIYIS